MSALPKLTKPSSKTPPGAALAPFFISLGFHLLMLPWVSHILGSHSASTIEEPPVLKATRVKIAQPEINQNLNMNGEVVDLNDNSYTSNKAPEDSRFLSNRNRIAEKQTQAKAVGIPSEGGNGGKSSQGTGKGSDQKQVHGKGLDLSVPKNFLSTQLGEEGATGKGSGRRVSMAPSNYLPEIAFGDETLLNTKEYVYASFFIRMKRQIEAIWQPLQWVDRFRENRDEFTTVLDITLKKDGYLDEVKVLEPSGRPSLDREAVKSVQQGGPYLNPPEGLVANDEKIHLGAIRFIVSLRNRF